MAVSFLIRGQPFFCIITFTNKYAGLNILRVDDMSLSTVNVSIESGLKEKAEALFKKQGLDMDSAVTLFLEEAVARGELPFDIPSEPNAETIKALEETEEILKHPERYKKYSSFDEALKDILDE